VSAVRDRVEVALAGLDRVADLHAVAWRDDDAVRAAAAHLGSDPIGPLHGVPISVKDWIEATPFPCAGGMPHHRDRCPTRDATVVARLRAAGAIVVCKANCGETSELHGTPRNPLDTTRTPGYSSSGDAVLVAAGVVPIGLGSDSGGSLRFPAHCTGLVTLRSTYGRVPVSGHFPRAGAMFDSRTVIGPLTRTVAEQRLLLGILAGPDGRDPSCPPVPLDEPRPVRGLRVAVVDGMQEGVVAALDRAGAVIVDDDDPLDIDKSRSITLRYWGRSSLTGPEVDEMLSDWDRSRARALRRLERYDAIVSPAAPHPAPLLGESSLADWTYMLGVSLWGWPALVVPAATSPEGLPLGVQIVAGPWREETCLALGEAVEGASG